MTLREAWVYINDDHFSIPKTPISLEEIEIIHKIKNMKSGCYTDNEVWQKGYEKGWETCFKDVTYRMNEVMTDCCGEMPESVMNEELRKFYKEAEHEIEGPTGNDES